MSALKPQNAYEIDQALHDLAQQLTGTIIGPDDPLYDEARAVEWIQEHIVGVSDEGLPQLANGRTFDVASVVWATGFQHDYSWIDLPLPIEDRWPAEYRGVVEELPGLYFLGLAFQYSVSSGEMSGVGRDAAYLANKIVHHVREREAVA